MLERWFGGSGEDAKIVDPNGGINWQALLTKVAIGVVASFLVIFLAKSIFGTRKKWLKY